MALRFPAVAFDLLSALVDSRALFEAVAGDPEHGGRWREAQLRLVARSETYRPFEQIIADAAKEADVALPQAAQLLAQWSELTPYADVTAPLQVLAQSGLRMVIVTNCSQRLAEVAAGRLPVRWHAVVSAEAAGFYKPDIRAYQAGCRAAGHPMSEVLFVPGSAQDLAGAERAGHQTYWVNRRHLPAPPDTQPLAVEPTLRRLPEVLGL